VLVLTRKLGEGIVLGEDVRLKVLRISGSRVTIGIEAPQHVRVLRSDLHDAPAGEHGPADAACRQHRASRGPEHEEAGDVGLLPTLRHRVG
jgi:carbon storage regulator CsrA